MELTTRPVGGDEVLYKLLKSIEKSPKTNQRKLADELGVSLGHMNYLLNDIVDKGWVEVSESTTNKRRACLYHLTPAGLTERAAVTMRYLQSLLQLQKSMNLEIETLREESNKISAAIQRGLSSLYA
ncbi:MAG: MarR family EPS-associated transcriptional regulator [Candidatus Riflebacteria bacterium]|jgi:EPS-associated MarR family transcriptional regulator|nr:MarR family EPS-associated transcriptional regulator [Candidatus Riflebacteria bacterium]